MNTNLVFGINTFKLALLNHFIMSTELVEFSEQLDEKFEPEEIDVEADDFWESVVNLFI